MVSSQKILAIVGPTTTGKTSLALRLAEEATQLPEFSGVDIISADSRQVYQGLEIVSGADVPSAFQKKKSSEDYLFYQHTYLDLRLYGVSIVNPTEEWSVSQFVKFARPIIDQAHAGQRLVIVVGGTGLYHQQLVKPLPSLDVKPDADLRAQADQMSVKELQNWLKKIDPKKLASLNQSDGQNPRRLVRAIEVSSSNNKSTTLIPALKSFTLGLEADLDKIEAKINRRVESRFENGAIQEVEKLLQLSAQSTSSALSSLGVPELRAYLQQKTSAEETKKLWALHEFQYAKRQLTWWKKFSPDRWLGEQESKNLMFRAILPMLLYPGYGPDQQ